MKTRSNNLDAAIERIASRNEFSVFAFGHSAVKVKAIMKLSDFPKLFLVMLLVGVQSTWALAADYESIYTGTWRNSDDIVNGWDWTLPDGVAPAPGSGIFNLNTSVPSDFPGYHLKQVNAKWRDLEPTEGNYDFSSILNHLNDPNFDGVMLNIRGMVSSIIDASGNPTLPWEVTAPTWLTSQLSPTDFTQEALKYNHQITNMNIYHPRVKAGYIALIRAIGATSIPGDSRLVAQIVHGVSSSRGEEWTGKQASRVEAVAAMEEIIDAWADAYGSNSKKLAWLLEDPKSLYDAAVVRGGMGIRGGHIEKWLRWDYSPGDVSETGQMHDVNGYLTVDEGFAPIAHRRHFGDQNEEYRSGSLVPQAKWRQNYRMANLRMLQMRRNVAWTADNSSVNPRMDNWLSLELGQTSESAPDAWVLLMRSWTRYGGANRAINNLERWLYQRDINGVTTVPKLNVEHGFDAANNKQLPSDLRDVDMARSAPSIGIAVDDDFLSGGPHSVAIKVTYFDSANEEWSLVYNKSGGGTASRSTRGNATNSVRTATFFLSDFMAPKSGYNFDFKLESNNGNTPFMFVRVIRLGQQSVPQTAVPNPPPDFAVLP